MTDNLILRLYEVKSESERVIFKREINENEKIKLGREHLTSGSPDVVLGNGNYLDRLISKEQAVIYRNGNDFYVCDGNFEGVPSTNGTYLNGEKIDFNNGTKLSDGDNISFGGKMPLYILRVGISKPNFFERLKLKLKKTK